jgi:hypothetical protein
VSTGPYRGAPGLLPLDSPRWSELRHAYGSAADVPDWIRGVAADPAASLTVPSADRRDRPTPWDQMFVAVLHQDSVYSATYAVLPHLVEIAMNGSWLQRERTLWFVGAV